MATREQVAIAEAERRYPDPIYPDGWLIKRGQRNAFVNGAQWQREQDDGEVEELAIELIDERTLHNATIADLARYKAFTEDVMALVGKWESVDITPAGFYPEAHAHVDGQEVAYEAAADAIRDAAERAGVSGK